MKNNPAVGETMRPEEIGGSHPPYGTIHMMITASARRRWWTGAAISHGLLVICSALLLTALLPQRTAAHAMRPVPSAAAPDFAAIDHYIEAEMQATRLPGVALAIVHGDEIVHLKGFGQADPSGRPVTLQTPFAIGSTTKSFTALAIMQLVEAGKLELDAPVQRYVPWFRVADAAASARITLRHLLNQTSGLPTRETTDQLIGHTTGEGALEQYVRSLMTVNLTYPVGQTFQYSNSNWNVLGLIVQTVSGQSYEAYVQEHIFTPLNMVNSYASPEEARAHGRATGYHYWFGHPVPYEMPYNRGQLPAGFLSASAEDLAQYLIAHLNGGRYAGASVLSPSGMNQLHQPATPIGYDGASYAMGWFVSEINGVPTVSHGGDLATFHADLVLIPEGKWGIVLLMNGNNGLDNARIEHITTGVTSLVVGNKPSPFMASNTVRPSLLLWILLVSAVQLLGLIRSFVVLRRWQREPARRPRGWLRVGVRIVPPLVLNLLWALLLLVGLPTVGVLGAPLRALPIFAPDLGYALLLSSGLALGWGLIRPVLVLWVIRTRRVSQAMIVPQEIGASTTA